MLARPESRTPEASAPEADRPYREVDSRELFGATRELRIHHLGQEYRLRVTRQQKLILTK